MPNWNFFKNSKKNWYQALKNIVPDVSWSSSGQSTNKQVFCHIYFILRSMHHCALFLKKKFYEFYWRLFFTNFFDKKIILNGHLEGYAYGESNFFRNYKKKLRLGLKKHCSGCFLKHFGSFFKQARILSHRFHTQ